MSSLVGHDALVQVFNDINLARTSALQLWEQVCMTLVRAQRCQCEAEPLAAVLRRGISYKSLGRLQKEQQ